MSFETMANVHQQCSILDIQLWNIQNLNTKTTCERARNVCDIPTFWVRFFTSSVLYAGNIIYLCFAHSNRVITAKNGQLKYRNIQFSTTNTTIIRPFKFIHLSTHVNVYVLCYGHEQKNWIIKWRQKKHLNRYIILLLLKLLLLTTKEKYKNKK